MIEKTVSEKIDRAKAKLLIDNRFFGALVLYFDIKEGTLAPTAYTDFKSIYYNPDFINQCTPNEVTGLLLHELLHNYFKHFIRFDIINKDFVDRHYLNCAMDFAINAIILKECRNVELPCYKRNEETGEWEDGVIGENMLYLDKYNGWNAEKIFQDLKKSKKYKEDKKKYEKMKQQLKDATQCKKCGGSGQVEKEEKGENGENKESGENGEQDGEGKGEEKESDGSGEGSGNGTGEKEKSSKGNGNGNGEESIDGSLGGSEPCPDCGGSGNSIPQEWDTDVDKSHSASSKGSDETKKEKGGKDKAEEEMDSKIHRAFNALSTKDRGKVPQQMKLVIDEYMEKLKGKIHWRKYLKSMIQQMGKEQYTMQKYNRRYMGRGIYLPSTMGKKIVIGLSLDTSGSIGRKEQEEFIGEVRTIMTQFPGIEVLIYGCDAAIHGKMKLKGKKQFKVKDIEKCLIGGGGTSHFPIFEDIRENREKMKMMFCFTDGYSDINSIPNNLKGLREFQTYWVLPEDCKDVELNWGKKVIIFDEHRSK